MKHSNPTYLRAIFVGTCMIIGLLLGCSKEPPTNSTGDVQSGLIGPGDTTVTKVKGLVSAVNDEHSIIWLQVTHMKVMTTDMTTIQQVLETKEVISITISEISINDLIIARGHYGEEVTHGNNQYKITSSFGSQNSSSFMADHISVYQSISDTCDTCGYWSLCDSVGGFADSCWTQYPPDSVPVPTDTCWVPCDSTNPNDTCRIYFPCDSGPPPPPPPPADTCWVPCDSTNPNDTCRIIIPCDSTPPPPPPPADTCWVPCDSTNPNDTCRIIIPCDSTPPPPPPPADTCWVPCDSTNPNDTCRIIIPCDSTPPPPPPPADTCWVPCDSNNPNDTCRIIIPCDSTPPPPPPPDSCCVATAKYLIGIEKTNSTPLGSIEDVSIFFENGTEPGSPMGGFDLLIQYDHSILSFMSADPGELIGSCGWEYFEYRNGVATNCGSNPCPTDKIRVVAVADINDGPNHPTCYGETPTVLRELAVLHFLVTSDTTFRCQYAPIQFCWYDCGDNAISSKIGDTLFISRNVYNSGNPNNVAGDFPFPSLYGANSTCDTLPDDGEWDLKRCIDFINGGIGIVCPADS